MKKIGKKIGFALLVTFGFFWLFVLYAQWTLPTVVFLKIKNPTTTAFMERYKGEKPLQFAWVPYSQISHHLKEAVVVAEDGSFFLHSGFDWHALQDAFQKNVKKKRIVRGGSTITQQLAKNLYLSPSKNPLRKIREILITIQLEQNLSKQRILELYLNVVEWGNGIYGAEAAAKHYFNTKASHLSASQAAWLASILPNPRFYDKNRGNSYAQAKASRIMKIMGYREKIEKIEEKPVEFEEIEIEEIELPPEPPPPVDIYEGDIPATEDDF